MVDRIGGAGLPESAGVPEISGGLGAASGVRSPQGPETGLSFDQILQQQTQSIVPAEKVGVDAASAAAAQSAASERGEGRVRFSAHAQQRLAQAAVHLNPQAIAKLEAAVDKAGQKVGKESLILLDDLAFVVSVKNRTVITAVDADRMADNVFTKIDSVVIAKDRGSE